LDDFDGTNEVASLDHKVHQTSLSDLIACVRLKNSNKLTNKNPGKSGQMLEKYRKYTFECTAPDCTLSDCINAPATATDDDFSFLFVGDEGGDDVAVVDVAVVAEVTVFTDVNADAVIDVDVDVDVDIDVDEEVKTAIVPFILIELLVVVVVVVVVVKLSLELDLLASFNLIFSYSCFKICELILIISSGPTRLSGMYCSISSWSYCKIFATHPVLVLLNLFFTFAIVFVRMFAFAFVFAFAFDFAFDFAIDFVFAIVFVFVWESFFLGAGRPFGPRVVDVDVVIDDVVVDDDDDDDDLFDFTLELPSSPSPSFSATSSKLELYS
jgi:hypothetical protein